MDKKNSDVQQYKVYLLLALKYWYVLVGGILIGVVISYYKARYLIPKYEVFSRILVEDDYSTYSKATFLPGMQLFGSKNKMENEIGIIKSFSLIKKAIEKTPEAYINYIDKGLIKDSYLYTNAPFKVVIQDSNIKDLKESKLYDLKLFNNYFMFKSSEEDNYRKLKYNQIIELENKTKISIKLRTEKTSNLEKYQFFLEDINKLAKTYRDKLRITVEDEYSTLLNLDLKGVNYLKEIAVLNQIGQEYIDYGSQESIKIAQNTINFVGKQLKNILDSLIISEENLKSFKLNSNKNKLYFSENTSIIQEVTDLEKKVQKLTFNINFYTNTLNEVETYDDVNDIIIPYFITDTPPLYEMLNTLMKLYQNRDITATDLTEDNEYLIRLNKQIRSQKKLLANNLSQLISKKVKELNNLKKQQSVFEKKLNQLPDKERKYIVLKRNYKINNDLYVFLVKKRSEAEIAKASKTSKAQILDYANIYNIKKVNKHTSSIYRENIFLSIILSLIIIFLLEAFHSKIYSRSDVERLTSIPIIGSILNNDKNGDRELVNFKETKSLVSESFRNLRTNLNFILPVKKNTANTIIMTSSVSSEGKTFCSINLALSYAFTNKKTLIIGADLRKPRFNNYFSLTKKSNGLSNFLQYNSDNFSELITKGEKHPYLDVLPSGPIPPNPSEILANEKTKDLFNQLKKEYDYIIIDTPPVIVSDIFNITKYADLILFCIRENYTKYKNVRNIEKIYNKESVLPKLGLVINGVKIKKKIYGDHNYYYYSDNDNKS